MSKLTEFGHMINNFGKNFIQKYSASFGPTSPYRRVGDRFPIPRKGEQGNLSSAAASSLGFRLPEKKVTRHMILAPQTLRRLGDTDPITWAIKRTRRHQISHARWDIVPNLDDFISEVDKWQEVLFDNLNNWNYFANIKLQHIPEDLYFRYKSDLDAVFNDLSNKYDKKARIKWIMKTLIREKKDRSSKHCSEVKKIFNRPCNEYTTFGALQEILTDDMIIFDAGVLIKNNDKLGRLAEIYPIPGEEMFLYRNEDRTIPEPPEAAFLWEEAGSKKAEFDRDEVVYIMCNPQHNFYGRSPVEVSSYVITTSLYADSYNMDFFKYSDVPPGILNLGKDINDDQRRAFKASWEAEKAGRGGIFRMMFVSGSDGVEFIPLRTQTQKDIQLQEYLKWSLSIKCACHQISPQDIGFTMDLHRTTSESQLQISRDSGLRIMLEKLSDHYNNDVVKKEYPSYSDAKFKYLDMDTVDEIARNNMATQRYESGMITLNEAREDVNKKPVPGGDVLLSQRIPGQGFMPVNLLEKESDKLEMVIEQEQTESDDAAQGGLPHDEQGNVDQGNIPSQSNEASIQPAKQQSVQVQPNVVGMTKLQKYISDLPPGQSMSISFSKPHTDDVERRRKQLEGFKAGLADPQLQAAANVFSKDPDERTLGTYALVALGSAAVAPPVYSGIKGGAKELGGPAKMFASRVLIPYHLRNEKPIIDSAVKLVHRMPGTVEENSRIVANAIKYYRGKKNLPPINNLHTKLAGLANKFERVGFKILRRIR